MLKCSYICKRIAFTNNITNWIESYSSIRSSANVDGNRLLTVCEEEYIGWVSHFFPSGFHFVFLDGDRHPFCPAVSHRLVLAHRCYYSGIEQIWMWWGYKGSVPFYPRAKAQQKPFLVISRIQRKMRDAWCFAPYESWYLWKPKVCPFILPLSLLCSTGI